MIYIDSRVGSHELAPYLTKLGVPVKLDVLESADFAFSGEGPNGEVVVGIERKTLTDLIQSRNQGRFAGTQVPLLCSTYHDVYLLVEGMYKIGDEGELLVFAYGTKTWQPMASKQGRYIMYSEVFKYTLSFYRACGIVPLWSVSKEHSARLIAAMYWHYKSAWKDHKSHIALNQSHTVGQNRFSFRPDTTPSIVRMVASQLPHVGYKKSAEVEKVFPTVSDMCMATVKEWCKVPGIGKTIALQIYKSLNEPGGRVG